LVHWVPVSPQSVPSAALFAWQVPLPLQVSAAVQALEVGSPHAVPAVLKPWSWQPPARQASCLVLWVPASPQNVPSEATFAWQTPAPSQLSGALQALLDGSPHAVPAMLFVWTQALPLNESFVHGLPSLQSTVKSPSSRAVVMAPSLAVPS